MDSLNKFFKNISGLEYLIIYFLPVTFLFILKIKVVYFILVFFHIIVAFHRFKRLSYSLYYFVPFIFAMFLCNKYSLSVLNADFEANGLIQIAPFYLFFTEMALVFDNAVKIKIFKKICDFLIIFFITIPASVIFAAPLGGLDSVPNPIYGVGITFGLVFSYVILKLLQKTSIYKRFVSKEKTNNSKSSSFCTECGVKKKWDDQLVCIGCGYKFPKKEDYTSSSICTECGVKKKWDDQLVCIGCGYKFPKKEDYEKKSFNNENHSKYIPKTNNKNADLDNNEVKVESNHGDDNYLDLESSLFNFKLSKLVRIASEKEFINHITIIKGDDKKIDIETEKKNLLVLRYTQSNAYHNELRAPLYMVALAKASKKDFNSFWNGVIAIEKAQVTNSNYLEGKKKKNSKFKNIDYNFFWSKNKDVEGEFYRIVYLIRLISNDRLYILYMHSGNDYKIEDIFDSFEINEKITEDNNEVKVESNQSDDNYFDSSSSDILSSNELKSIKSILISLNSNIKKCQGFYPDNWWLIVKERGMLMKSQASEFNAELINPIYGEIQGIWTFIHFEEYKKRTDWLTYEDKCSEIGFRIERFSEILFFLENAFKEVAGVSSKIGSTLKDFSNADKIILDFKLNITVQDFSWWMASAYASLHGCYVYARKIGMSNNEIKNLISVDLAYKAGEVDSLLNMQKNINKTKEIKNEVKAHSKNINDGPNEDKIPERINFNDFKSVGFVNFYNGSPYTGTGFELDREGNIKTEFNLVNGIKNGKAVEFYENGKVKIESFYINNKLTGLSTTFFKNGKVKSQAAFNNGKLIDEKSDIELNNETKGNSKISKEDAKNKLLELKEYLDLGIITQDEFDEKAKPLKNILLNY